MTSSVTAVAYGRVAQLLSIEEALALVLERARPLAAERVLLADAAGRYLAAPAASVVDLPPFRSSAMDGFAIRAADAPGTLPVAERVAAGRPAERALQPGEAFAISTGGVVPEGADAVVPIEDVVERDNTIEISRPVVQNDNVRPVGGDIRAGETVVGAGVRVGAAQVGALAAAGIAEVTCGRRPRVAVLSTGTELRPPGGPLGPGQIYEANSHLLAAAVASAGAQAERLHAVEDDESAHRKALELGLAHDVLVTSGGVSVGPHDLVRRVEAELGVKELFWRVAVKPGKPVSFAVRGRTLVFGLPGNPVSSLVSSVLFLLPALRALQGAAAPGPHWERGELATALRRGHGRDELVRARSEEGVLHPLRGQDSHMIARAAAADALVLVPRGAGELAAGERVRYLRLP
jgi:molybdopterin molybdotransferase